MLYLLDLKASYGSEKKFQVKPVKARSLKVGGYGKEYNLTGYDVLGDPQRLHSPNLYFDDNDVEIFRGLNALESNNIYYSHQRIHNLENEQGGSLLLKMLKSGRCFWQTQQDDRLLSLGNDRVITLKWNTEGNKKRIGLDSEIPLPLLLPLGDLYYLDPTKHEAGRLIHETLNQKQIKYFLKAPPVPLEKAEALTAKLLHLFPETEVPLPEPIDIQNIEITGEKPRFHLHLHADNAPKPGGYGSYSIHIASLSLQYGSLLYQPQTHADTEQPVTTKLEGTTRYRIHRDIEAEQTAFHRLKSYGFDSLDPNQTPFGVFDMVIFAPDGMQHAIEKWDHFKVQGVPSLEAEGWTITIDDSFRLQIDTSDDWHADLEESEGGDWFELSLGFELNGQRINLLPLIVELLAADNHDTKALHERLKQQEYQLFQIDDYHWVKVPCKRLVTVLDTLIELYNIDSLNADGNLEFSKYEGMHYGALLNDPGLRWKGAGELKALNQQLQSFEGIEAAELPQGLQADLREYQQTGADFK